MAFVSRIWSDSYRVETLYRDLETLLIQTDSTYFGEWPIRSTAPGVEHESEGQSMNTNVCFPPTPDMSRGHLARL
jgi:hypothetical protein